MVCNLFWMDTKDKDDDLIRDMYNDGEAEIIFGILLNRSIEEVS